MRLSAILCVLGPGCVSRGFAIEEIPRFDRFDTGSDELCSYNIQRVAEGAEIVLDFSGLLDRDNIDRIVLGHLPFGRSVLEEGDCGPFDWTEMLLPSEDDYTLSVPASQVGADGGSLVVTLRSADIEIASVTLVPSPNNDRTEVSFSP